ncbi:MAG: hypothetical protein PUG21_01520 [Prevotella sp.]|nr:hypothetical protein [Prevotella sp.]
MIEKTAVFARYLFSQLKARANESRASSRLECYAECSRVAAN